jgi:dihydrofolate reductase
MTRKIQAGEFMTLNGVVQEPGEWVFPYFTPDVGKVIGDNMDASDCMLLGRKTYEAWAEYWPGKTAEEDGYADYINNVQKYVVSSTLEPPLTWEGTELFRGLDEVRKLKEQDGKNIAISGSITLVGSLLQEGLLDELALLVAPIVIGQGIRLFDGPAGSVGLKLVSHETFDNGVQSLVYAPASS